MKKLMFMAGAAVLGLALVCLPANAADQKIATVNLQKAFEKYYKTVRSNEALQQQAAEMDKDRKEMFDMGKKQEADFQKLLDKSEDQAISAEERGRSKKSAEDKLREVKDTEQRIREYDNMASTKLRETKRQRMDDILKEIRGFLDAEAKAGGYALVLDISGESANMAPVVLYSNGVNDLTENLIKELNAGAPATSSEDQTSKPGKSVK